MGSVTRQQAIPATETVCRLRPFTVRRVCGFETILESGETLKILSAKTSGECHWGRPSPINPALLTAAEMAARLVEVTASWEEHKRLNSRAPNPPEAQHWQPRHTHGYTVKQDEGGGPPNRPTAHLLSDKLNPRQQPPVHRNGIGKQPFVSEVATQHVRYYVGCEFRSRGSRKYAFCCRR